MSRRGSSTSRPGAARPEDSPGTGGFLPLPLAGVGGGRRERGAGKDGGALVQQRGGGGYTPEPCGWSGRIITAFPARARTMGGARPGASPALVSDHKTHPSKTTQLVPVSSPGGRERLPGTIWTCQAFHELTWSPWAPPGTPRAPFLAEPS